MVERDCAGVDTESACAAEVVVEGLAGRAVDVSMVGDCVAGSMIWRVCYC